VFKLPPRHSNARALFLPIHYFDRKRGNSPGGGCYAILAGWGRKRKKHRARNTMDKFRKFKFFQDHGAEAKAAFDINEKLELSYYSLWQNVKNLSGGNQQKIVIAKWMLRNSEIILLDEPTRGIDVGAKFEIYKLINEFTRQGKSVVLVSPELEELIGLCNRIYIMFEGSIMDVVEGERRTQEVIIHSLLGVSEHE
jgi:ABC-type sugar transport system ATPase subunit